MTFSIIVLVLIFSMSLYIVSYCYSLKLVNVYLTIRFFESFSEYLVEFCLIIFHFVNSWLEYLFCCIFCWGVYGFQGEVFWICLLGLWLSMDLGWWVGDVEPWLCCCTLCTQQICPLHYVHCSKESLFYFYFFCSPL